MEIVHINMMLSCQHCMETYKRVCFHVLCTPQAQRSLLIPDPPVRHTSHVSVHTTSYTDALLCLIDVDLSDVCISAILVIGQDS